MSFHMRHPGVLNAQGSAMSSVKLAQIPEPEMAIGPMHAQS